MSNASLRVLNSSSAGNVLDILDDPRNGGNGQLPVNEPISPDLTKILQAPDVSFADPLGPRFMIPTAPGKQESGSRAPKKLKAIVQKLFGRQEDDRTAETASEAKEKPLIASIYSKSTSKPMNSKPYQPLARTASSNLISRTLSVIGSRILSPMPRSPSHRLSVNIASRPDTRNTTAPPLKFEYSLSLDELAGGLAGGLPSPCQTSANSLEARIEANYHQCMLHSKTVLHLSLPECLSALARHAAEEVRLDQRGRLYLMPLKEEMHGAHFLSRTHPTRIGRNYKFFGQKKCRVVSRNHAEVFIDGSSAYIVDVGSAAGTFVNGERISGAGAMSVPWALNSGDLVQLGVDQACANGELEEGIQLMVLIGHPLKQPKPLKIQENGLFTREKISKLYKKAMSSSPQASTKLYLEFGDLLHENSFGYAMLARPDGSCYAARFNNYKLNWEVALCNVRIEDYSSTTCVISAVGSKDPEQKQFVVVDADGKKTARVNLRDQDKFIVTLLSDSAAVGAGTAQKPHTSLAMQIARPAIPYVSVSPGKASASPSSPYILLPTFKSSLDISKPEIPFYTGHILANGQMRIIARDRNNLDKERLLGVGSKVKGKLSSSWGRKTLVWEGDLTVGKDDQLIVMALILKLLVQLE